MPALPSPPLPGGGEAAETAPAGLTGRWATLGYALAIQIASSGVSAALAVLLPFVKADLHLSFAQAGLLVNISVIGGFLTIALSGWAVDALGDRLILVLASALSGTGAVLGGLTHSYPVLIGSLVVMGAGVAMSTPAGSVAVRRSFPVGLRGTVMSLRQTGIPLGTGLAAVTLPAAALHFGWRPAFAGAGLLSLLAGGACWLRYRAPGPSGRSPGGSRLRLRDVVNRDARIAAVGGMLLVCGQFCLLTYLVSYLIRDRGIPLALAAIYLGLAQLTGAGARVFWGVLSDRFLGGSRRVALVLAAATGTAGCLGLALLPSPIPLAILLLAVFTSAFGSTGWQGVQISFLSELAPRGAEGRTVGTALTVQQVGILGGPYLFGLIVDATGSFRSAWFSVAVVLALAVAVMASTRDIPAVRSPGAAGERPAPLAG